MGDVVLGDRCDKFIDEFGDDLVKAFGPTDPAICAVIKNVRVEADDSFEVYLYADLYGAEYTYTIRFHFLFFNATMEDDEVLVSDVATHLSISYHDAEARLKKAGLLGDDNARSE